MHPPAIGGHHARSRLGGDDGDVSAYPADRVVVWLPCGVRNPGGSHGKEDCMSDLAPLAEYDALLHEVRGLLQAARNRAYQAVDNIKVQAYWQVGERIVRAELEHKERADY